MICCKTPTHSNMRNRLIASVIVWAAWGLFWGPGIYYSIISSLKQTLLPRTSCHFGRNCPLRILQNGFSVHVSVFALSSLSSEEEAHPLLLVLTPLWRDRYPPFLFLCWRLAVLHACLLLFRLMLVETPIRRRVQSIPNKAAVYCSQALITMQHWTPLYWRQWSEPNQVIVGWVFFVTLGKYISYSINRQARLHPLQNCQSWRMDHFLNILNGSAKIHVIDHFFWRPFLVSLSRTEWSVRVLDLVSLG